MRSFRLPLTRRHRRLLGIPQFVIEHAGNPEYSLGTRSSDGQVLFLANKLSKMKRQTGQRFLR